MIEISSSLVLLDILLIAATYLLIKNSIKTNYTINKFSVGLAYILFALLCLFSFYDTDWFHYQEIMSILKQSRFIEYGLDTNMEPGYISIAESVGYKYIPFRAIVWGASLLSFIYTIKRYNLNAARSLLFILPFVIIFTYARVTLTMALAFFAFSFIVKPIKNRKIISYTLALSVLCIVLLYLHKSAIILLPVFVLSLFHFNKKSIYTILPILILIILSMNLVIGYYNTFLGDVNAEYLDRYMEESTSEQGIGEKVYRFMSSTPFYLIALYIINCIRKGVYIKWPYYIKANANVAIWTILISTAFIFSPNPVLFYRFLNYAMIPCALTTCFACTIKEEQKRVSKILNINIFILFYILIYRYYLFTNY